MKGSLFEAWTRRRFSWAAGNVLAAALGGAASEPAGAKRKRKKRCRALGKTCKQGNKQKRCCGDLRCDVLAFEPSAQTRCCKSLGIPCTDHLDCCGGLCCGPEGACTDKCLISDRALKANFGSIDADDMLARVRELSISTWNYTSDDPAVRHVGPMAQDFSAVFGVGADDRHIHPLDGQGVALAAIQALASQVDAQREQNARLAARIAAIESANDACVVRSR